MDFYKQRLRLTILLRLLICLLFAILIYTFFAEKTINSGAGYDGLYYRDLVRNFPEMLSNSFSNYKASRILPFAVAHYFLRIFQIDPTDIVIMNTIWFMILMLMMLAVVFYFKIAKLMQWREDVQVIGFVLLFFNFGILKYIGYYPILTDHFIFPLTIIILYFYLSKQQIVMMVLGFAACFIWPTYSLFIPLLLLNNPVEEQGDPKMSKFKNLVWKVLKLGLALLPIVMFVYLIRQQNLWVDKRFLTAARYAIFRPYNLWIAILSLVALYVYYLALLRPVKVSTIHAFIRSIFKTRILQIVPAVIFLLAVFVAKFMLTNGNTEVPYPTLTDLLIELTFRPAVSPFNFLVFGFWFLGFILFFVIVYYEQILEQFLKMGNGYFLILVYSLIFLTAAQPRLLTTMLPFVLLPVLQLLQVKLGRKPAQVTYIVVFVIAALVVSRFWLPIALNDHYMQDGDTSAEKYPMFIGPWISDKFYIILGSIAVLLFFIWNKFIHQPMLRSSANEIERN